MLHHKDKAKIILILSLFIHLSCNFNDPSPKTRPPGIAAALVYDDIIMFDSMRWDLLRQIPTFEPFNIHNSNKAHSNKYVIEVHRMYETYKFIEFTIEDNTISGLSIISFHISNEKMRKGYYNHEVKITFQDSNQSEKYIYYRPVEKHKNKDTDFETVAFFETTLWTLPNIEYSSTGIFDGSYVLVKSLNNNTEVIWKRVCFDDTRYFTFIQKIFDMCNIDSPRFNPNGESLYI